MLYVSLCVCVGRLPWLLLHWSQHHRHTVPLPGRSGCRLSRRVLTKSPALLFCCQAATVVPVRRIRCARARAQQTPTGEPNVLCCASAPALDSCCFRLRSRRAFAVAALPWHVLTCPCFVLRSTAPLRLSTRRNSLAPRTRFPTPRPRQSPTVTPLLATRY